MFIIIQSSSDDGVHQNGLMAACWCHWFFKEVFHW